MVNTPVDAGDVLVELVDMLLDINGEEDDD